MTSKVSKVLSLVVVTLESNPPQYIVQAAGEVPSGGWRSPRLVPTGDSVDGIQNFDFVADPPSTSDGVIAMISSVTASVKLGPNLEGLRGVAINSATNSLGRLLEESWPAARVAAGGVDVWPWFYHESDGTDVIPRSLTTLPSNIPLSLRDLVGRRLRVVRPGDKVKMDLVPGRVTIHLDEESRATDIVVESGAM
jgi:hypothetical protein